jgi:DMSO/TMAO reductase YedYZ molybdopterin-dependent catalytic subunit
VPAGAELDVPGLSPLFTPNADFYRVDTALTVPAIDPSTWRLVVDGMVDRRIELSFDDLVGMGLDEYGITLTCVSNEVGGGLVGNARWLGVPVRDILRMADRKPAPTWCSHAASTATPRALRCRRSRMTGSTRSWRSR